jgi:hypothetical protein
MSMLIKHFSALSIALNTTRKETQAHGFSWEKELISKVYGATQEELKKIKYTSKIDLPAELNKLDKCDVSIKTSCSLNAVCMADCLRIFDEVSSGKPFHLTTVFYKQNDELMTKNIMKICEVDLTAATTALFGSVTRKEIEGLAACVKAVPQKRKPTDEEYNAMYAMRDELQPRMGALHLDIKCNSQQSRLQCSFNAFQKFLEENPARVVATSENGEFRGGKIKESIVSSRRKFKKDAIED